MSVLKKDKNSDFLKICFTDFIEGSNSNQQQQALEEQQVLDNFHQKLDEYRQRFCPDLTKPHPAIFITEKSDRALFEQGLRIERKRAVAGSTSSKVEAVKTPPPASALDVQTYTPPLPQPQPYFGPALADLCSQLRNSSRGRRNEPTIHDFIRQVLMTFTIVTFDNCFYWRQEGGFVFSPISNEELTSLIYSTLRPTLEVYGKTFRLAEDIVRSLKYEQAIRVFAPTETLNRIFFLNGTVNPATGQLTPFLKNDFSPTFINFPYPTEHVKCPRFDAFLDNISRGDPAIQMAIWQMVGYLLTPDTAGKVFFVLQGVGDSGKSVLGNLISSFFNPEAVAYLDIYRFKDRFSTSLLQGKRLNISMDLPNTKISREAIGTIKMITGDDIITVEQKFKDATPIKPTCKLVFGTNHPLILSDQDDAFKNRLIVIPFRYQVPKDQQDKGLLAALKQERPAIAAQALAVYHELRCSNYQFVRPANDGLLELDSQRSVLQGFLEELCSFTADAFTPTAALHQRYLEFCHANQLPGEENCAQFSRRLNELCSGKISKKKRRMGAETINGYDGILIQQ